MKLKITQRPTRTVSLSTHSQGDEQLMHAYAFHVAVSVMFIVYIMSISDEYVGY